MVKIWGLPSLKTVKHSIFSIIVLIALAAIFLLFRTEPNFWFLIGGVVVVFVLVTAYGSVQIQANYFVDSINHGENTGIALTFDDGPDPNITPQILKILEQHNLTGTFFIIGKKADTHPELLKEIHQKGHIIGNHSFSHSPYLPFFSTNKLKADIQHCSDIIKTLTGSETQLFRPPFGVTNPRYAKMLKQLELQSIGWNIRSLDTIFKSPKQLFKRITKKIEKGSILLFHDTQQVTLQTLPELIRYCEEEGIKILPLDKLINKQPYEKK
jgi:peptidoglycan/xylan/chitin deacetylase (PgdA/CDA1 family)